MEACSEYSYAFIVLGMGIEDEDISMVEHHLDMHRVNFGFIPKNIQITFSSVIRNLCVKLKICWSKQQDYVSGAVDSFHVLLMESTRLFKYSRIDFVVEHDPFVANKW